MVEKQGTKQTEFVLREQQAELEEKIITLRSELTVITDDDDLYEAIEDEIEMLEAELE